MRRGGILLPAVALVAAALLGAAIALAGAEAFDIGDTKTTQIVGGAPTESPVAFPPAPGQRFSVNEIYKRSAPGVVRVTARSIVQGQPADPFFPFQLPPQESRSLGSGFVIEKSGHIVTNYHVVRGAREVEVSFNNNEKMKAKIVGTDPSTDLAVLKVDADSRALTPLPLGDSDTVQVGDDVVAIGNPFGYERSVTRGIVSALHRKITAPDQYEIDEVIQTDAPINQGNSGGPLINARGQVIGVNAQISTGGTGAQGNVGIGFAIPVNTVREVADQLIKKGKVERVFLGVGVQPITAQVSRLFRLPTQTGLLVTSVRPGSGAAKAGLRAGRTEVIIAGQNYRLGGDVIVKADGVAVPSVERLRDVIESKRPGDRITLEIFRGSERKELRVKLGKRTSG